MQAANLATEAMEGCVEYLELEVGGIQTWAHAFVVEQAPFRLLLGRPWQKSVKLKKEEKEDGMVLVTIHDPKDRRRAQIIETRAREGEELKGIFMFRSVESVVKAWRATKPSNAISKIIPGRQIQDIPVPLAEHMLAKTFYYNPMRHTLAYKKAAKKTHPVPTTLPQ